MSKSRRDELIESNSAIGGFNRECFVKFRSYANIKNAFKRLFRLLTDFFTILDVIIDLIFKRIF